MATNAYIVGCVRNCGKYIDSVFENISNMAKMFDETRVVIALGESTDDTEPKLNALRAKYSSHFSITLLRNPTEKNIPVRPGRISAGRNTILKYIRLMKQHKNDPATEWKYMIMLDMDDVTSTPIDMEVFRNALRRDSEWDAISFNAPNYYDIWALSYKPYTISCWNWGIHSQHVVHFMSQDIQARLNTLQPDELFECESAFNGLAIYKLDKFLDCNYDYHTLPVEKLDLDDLEYSTGFFKYILNTNNVKFIPPMLNQDCEHRAFHAEARIKNGARIRISPKMLFPTMGVI